MSNYFPVGTFPIGCLLIGFSAAMLGPSCLFAQDREDASAAAVVAAVNVDDALEQAMEDLSLFSPRLLREFYAARGISHAWSPDQAASMLGLAQGSVVHGLDAKDFNVDAIQGLLAAHDLDASDNSAARWRADLILSDALLRYLHHLQYGKYNPKEINPDWTFVASVDAAALQAEMQEVLAADELSAAVDAVLPHAPFYEQLKLGYARYLSLSERLQDEGGWTPLPAGPNLKIGMRDSRVPRIREQLALLDGDDFPPTADPDIYDKALYEALREFQKRSGLAPDGVIGPRTLAALNRPLDESLAAIRANLERMRWLYHELPHDYLLVDIAAYQLELVRDQQLVWSTRAVVGTDENQTPMFRDEMEHLVFNPTWSVPSSIQKKMRGVPSDYHVIDRRTGRRAYPTNPTDHRRYRLVQQPGPKNALGKVKFMFPNGHAIYLHDTPSRHLFARGRRAYSHGCVRVQEPLDLAREVLVSQNWDMSAINRVIDSGRTRYVNLDEHLPVLLYYLTARADEQGRVGFRNDLYQRDASLLSRLGGPRRADRLVFSEVEAPVTEPELQSPATTTAMPTPTATAAKTAEPVASSGAAEAGLKATVNAQHDGQAELLSPDQAAPRAARSAGRAPDSSQPDASSPEASSNQQPAQEPWWDLSMNLQASEVFPALAATPAPSLSRPSQRASERFTSADLSLDQPMMSWRSQDSSKQATDANERVQSRGF
ncbi:MAG: L,D-transpeptidase family protein [Chromatiaceae bacterium]|nr:L,D-transpeptidase family protein [Chromatiaceae bacterium]